MKGYYPLDNGTLFSDGELWLLRTFTPENVPSRYHYLKVRIYKKMFGERGALNTIMNYVFSMKYEGISDVDLEEFKWKIDELIELLKA